MSETWRAVCGWEGFYEVSDMGRVRSLDREFIRVDGRRQCRRGRMLIPGMSGSNRQYPSVTLRFGRRYAVHVLVCTAFSGSRPSDAHQVAHGNGDPADNRASNLRWATGSENQQDSIRHGTKFVAPNGEHAGERNPNVKLTDYQVNEIRKSWANGTSQRRLAALYGVGKSQIHNITSRRQWVSL